MTLRLKIILTLLIGVTALVVFFAGFSIYRYFTKSNLGKEPQLTERELQELPQETPAQQDSFFKEAERTVPSTQQREGTRVPPQKPAQEADPRVRADLISFALPFAERFGSYSNQANYENLSDLLGFMTESMQSWAREKIASAKEEPLPTIYKGVTTKALSNTVISLDEKKGRAEIRITAQRKELIGSSTNFKVYNQDIVLSFIKEDSVWLVDSAVWK